MGVGVEKAAARSGRKEVGMVASREPPTSSKSVQTEGRSMSEIWRPGPFRLKPHGQQVSGAEQVLGPVWPSSVPTGGLLLTCPLRGSNLQEEECSPVMGLPKNEGAPGSLPL